MHRICRFSICIFSLISVILSSGLIAQTSDPAAVYQRYCSVCHGEQGDGRTHVRQGMQPPPRDFTAAETAALLSRERMIDAVRNGRPGTAMAAWGKRLDDAQIEAVVDYVRDRFMMPARTSASQRGALIYARNCSVCHGDQGAGAAWGRTSLQPPPRDFTAGRAEHELSRERMIAAVTHGRPGTAMAAFGSRLGASDIEAVVDYIRAAFMRPGARPGIAHTAAMDDKQASGIDMTAALPGLSGDPQIGKALYLQNCTACHGADGDGKGPRAYFIFPKPRNFRHPAARATFNRLALFAAIKQGVVGREMPAWGKVLDDQQIADISEFVFQTFIQKPEKP